MYIEKINGNVYLTVDKNVAKKQLEKLVNGVLSWIIASIGAAGILAVIYYGNIAYQYLTNLF